MSQAQYLATIYLENIYTLSEEVGEIITKRKKNKKKISNNKKKKISIITKYQEY